MMARYLQNRNCQGFARMKILKNANEILSGKTERVSHTVIGLDNEGRIINHQAQISFL
jgi:GTPase